jgi:hypothetical protein
LARVAKRDVVTLRRRLAKTYAALDWLAELGFADLTVRHCMKKLRDWMEALS